ncbi:hydantoinase B/oxoprolinase family protein [uncultured Hydrogenophaga sp.]|uniref:hydantoinase B/oxoprolinase family protein n=1 Tax=uncultured Hydrogenophaga sp. TaxID=199683 RepID=UPI00258AF57E|nr:hydantoinase B/oxoprolinase family protein [uncultured Hydrogenophaga sp.]
MSREHLILMEPVRLALQGIVDRMQSRMMRAAYSSIAREGGDCAAAVFLPDGRLLAQARSLPLLLGSLIPAIAGLLQRCPVAAMAEGDAWLMNDPWSGGTHLPDLIVVRPVFGDGAVIALAAAILHHQDVGGIAAGSIPPNATEIYQEGLRIPPVRWRAKGEPNPGIEALLAANSRTPGNLLGDLNAQWSAVSLGASEMAALRARTGAPFETVCDALLAQSERLTREALRAAPDGEWQWQDQLDGDGISDTPVRIAVSLCKRGDALTIDFTGSSPQTRGPVNASPSSMMSAILFFMRSLAPQAPNNAGCLAPATWILPEGSVVNPALPAAVNARTATLKLACNAMLGAWSSGASRDPLAANAGVATVLSLSGARADGQRWLLTEIIASGAGASAHGDGTSGVSTDVGNARNTPLEVIESEAPLRVHCYAIREASGGAGRFNGGHGVRRVYELLEGQGSVSYRGERHVSRARGSEGGGDGAPSAARVERSDGRVDVLPARARVDWSAGDRLVIETAGGGAWGEAMPRH